MLSWRACVDIPPQDSMSCVATTHVPWEHMLYMYLHGTMYYIPYIPYVGYNSTYHTYGTYRMHGTTCTSTCRCTVSMHPQDVVCICTTGWHAILGVHHRRTPSGCPSVTGYHRWCICCAESIPSCHGTMQGQNTSSSWSKRISSPVMEWYISMHNS